MSNITHMNAAHKSGAATSSESSLKVLLAVRDDYHYQPLKSALQQSGYIVTVTNNSMETLRIIYEEHPDIVILDSLLPEIGAIRICKNVRADPESAGIKVIILSDNKDITERIQALDAGSDDFLVKPFEMEVLLAKVSALQRKTPTGKLTHVLKAGTIEMVPEQWVVYVDGVPVNLTEKEYRLLQELLEVKGRVLSRESLLERVWGHQKNFNLETRTVDVHMSRLRNKLGSSGDNIITVRNVGYRINVSLDWLNH